MGTSLTPLPRDPIRKQIRRLAGLDYFPHDAEAVGVLVDVLARRCANEEHVVAVVSAWLEEHTAAPKLADLVPLIERLAPKAPPRPDSQCGQCSGSGFRQVPHMITIAGLDEQEYLFAEPCSCLQ